MFVKSVDNVLLRDMYEICVFKQWSLAPMQICLTYKIAMSRNAKSEVRKLLTCVNSSFITKITTCLILFSPI